MGGMTEVMILGAGFGGLELATLLSERLEGEADVTIVDQADERRVLGWRVWVPEGTPAGSSFLVHLVKRNRPGIKPQGGLTVQIRVTERA